MSLRGALGAFLAGLRGLTPGLGDRKARRRIDEVFSRNVLGSVLLGAAAGKIVEKVLNLVAPNTWGLLLAWSAAFLVFLLAFVWWEEIEDAAKEAAGGED